VRKLKTRKGLPHSDICAVGWVPVAEARLVDGPVKESLNDTDCFCPDD